MKPYSKWIMGGIALCIVGGITFEAAGKIQDHYRAKEASAYNERIVTLTKQAEEQKAKIAELAGKLGDAKVRITELEAQRLKLDPPPPLPTGVPTEVYLRDEFFTKLTAIQAQEITAYSDALKIAEEQIGAQNNLTPLQDTIIETQDARISDLEQKLVTETRSKDRWRTATLTTGAILGLILLL